MNTGAAYPTGRQACIVHRLGMVDYEQAWQLQAQMAAQIAAGARPPTLLLLEHPHTFTFGRRGDAANLLWDDNELARRGVRVHWVDRGGDVTYHGPGQLVGYPLLPLGRPAAGAAAPIPQADYVGYIRQLETMLIAALAQWGVSARAIAGLTGVWVETSRGPAKIAAIGVKVDAQGVTRHGFALNVHPQMEYWQGIVGCGLKDYTVTSLAALLDPPPGMPAVISGVVAAFQSVFPYQLLDQSQ